MICGSRSSFNDELGFILCSAFKLVLHSPCACYNYGSSSQVNSALVLKNSARCRMPVFRGDDNGVEGVKAFRTALLLALSQRSLQ